MSGWRDNDYYRYFIQQPPITRTYLAGVVAVSLPPLLFLVSPVSLINFWDYTLRGEVWRPLTAFLYGGSGMSLLFGVFFAYQYCMQLETGKFGHSTADFAYYLLFSMINIMVSLSIPQSQHRQNDSAHFWLVLALSQLPALVRANIKLASILRSLSITT